MMVSYLVLAMGWIIYCALHSLLATTKVKSWAAENVPSLGRYYRLCYTLFAFAGLVALLLFMRSIPTQLLYIPNGLSRTAGVVVGTSGLLLMFVCISRYFVSLSGITSLFREAPRSGKLIVSGVHRYVRHPLYLGTFAFIWGIFLYFPAYSLLVSFLIITIYTIMGIRWEEQKLVAEFGEQYIRYQREVPKLIPGARRTGPGNSNG